MKWLMQDTGVGTSSRSARWAEAKQIHVVSRVLVVTNVDVA
jgi:hypothetical protein